MVSSSSNKGLYAEVVEAASLGSLLLKESSFKILPEYYSADPSENLAFALDASANNASYDEETKTIIGQFDFRVTVKKSRKIIVDISSSYVVLYELSKEVDEKAAKDFCQRVGIFSCYPYFRQLASQYSQSSDARLPTLPVLRQSNIRRA